MELEKAVEIFKETGVMLEGHFLLTSGRHSNRYMQCARLFESAKHSEIMCADLAARFAGERIDLVVGPALGGVIMSYEMSRQLGVRNFFAERDNGTMTFRRGFAVQPGAQVLVVEDVVTTGGSVREVIDLVKQAGGEVVGVCSIVDRSAGKVDFSCRYEAVASMEVLSWDAAECPLCAAGSPAVKPGSRATGK